MMPGLPFVAALYLTPASLIAFAIAPSVFTVITTKTAFIVNRCSCRLCDAAFAMSIRTCFVSAAVGPTACRFTLGGGSVASTSSSHWSAMLEDQIGGLGDVLCDVRLKLCEMCGFEVTQSLASLMEGGDRTVEACRLHDFASGEPLICSATAGPVCFIDMVFCDGERTKNASAPDALIR